MSSPVDSVMGTRPVRVAGRDAREVLVADVRLEVTEGPDRGRAVSLSGPSLLIGKGAGADLLLTDPTVSGRHAMVRATESGVTLEDLGSRNGTWVQGVRIESGVMSDGATFRVGSTSVRVTTAPARIVVFPHEEPRFHGLIGGSPAMREIFAMVEQLARTDLPVLVTGETGTGKELVARALHAAGPRARAPLCTMDCASVRPELVRSELFGHERGAFTGADAARKGILEEATGGTAFFDEIGELELAVQPSFLRALETREVTRMGGSKATPINVRIVGATNQDLVGMAKAGKFRSDLYFRLACVSLRLPPLRERPEDIEPLARHFLAACATRNAAEPPELEADAIAWLASRPWSGNVRQLRNTMDAACMLAKGAVTRALVQRCLTGEESAGAVQPVAAPEAAAQPMTHDLPAKMAAIEKTELLRALEAHRWNRKAAARALGLSAATMFDKIKKHGLKPPE